MSTNEQRNTVTSRHVSFRWDEQEKELLITTQSEQIHLTPDTVMELLEVLYDHRRDILSAARALPEWAEDPGKVWPRSPAVMLDDVVNRHAHEEDVSTHE